MRRLNAAGADDDLASRVDPVFASVRVQLDACRPAVVDHHSRHQPVRQHPQVRPTNCGSEVGRCRGGSSAVADRALPQSVALRGRAVEILAAFELSQRVHRLEEGAIHGVGALDVHDVDGSASAVIRRSRKESVVLRAQKVGENLARTPARVSLSRPVIEVRRVAPVIGHPVDRSRAADDPAPGNGNAAVGEVGLRRRQETPVQLRRPDRRSDQRGNVNEGMRIPAACLDQAYGRAALFRQPVREHTARSPGPHDHVIVGLIGVDAPPHRPSVCQRIRARVCPKVWQQGGRHRGATPPPAPRCRRPRGG